MIAIKWSVMTTDNPHMRLGTLDSLGGCCLLMHHWNLKHIQMCVGQNHKPSRDPCHCFSACSCLICTGLLMEMFERTCNFFFLFFVQSPHIQHIFFPLLQLRGVKGQTVLVWWWWFGMEGGRGGWQLYEGGSFVRVEEGYCIVFHLMHCICMSVYTV